MNDIENAINLLKDNGYSVTPSSYVVYLVRSLRRNGGGIYRIAVLKEEPNLDSKWTDYIRIDTEKLDFTTIEEMRRKAGL